MKSNWWWWVLNPRPLHCTTKNPPINIHCKIYNWYIFFLVKFQCGPYMHNTDPGMKNAFMCTRYARVADWFLPSLSEMGFGMAASHWELLSWQSSFSLSLCSHHDQTRVYWGWGRRRKRNLHEWFKRIMCWADLNLFGT